MSRATGSSGRLWTQERFLTRQVDESQRSPGRVLEGSVFRAGPGSSGPGLWRRRETESCACPSFCSALEGDLYCAVPGSSRLSGFLGVKDKAEGFWEATDN